MVATRSQVVRPATTPGSTPRRMPWNEHHPASSRGGATLLLSPGGPHAATRARLETALRGLQRIARAQSSVRAGRFGTVLARETSSLSLAPDGSAGEAVS